MTIAKEFAAKLSVALVAVAMIFSAFASSASAQTTEELQQMINDLLAQVAQLQGQVGGDTGSTGTCMAPAQPLTIGSEGADVTALQNTLIAGGYSIPAGATGYFGTQTQSALAAWQAANAVSPAAGYYGPISKAALEAACAADDGDDTDGTDDSDDDSDDSDDGELEGEGTLEVADLELDDASDDEIEEGAEDAEVAVATLSAENGDIEVDRMTFTASSSAGATETEPWEVFETFSVWVDGDMVAEFDASDEDEYLDEDDGEFRFSGLEIVVREDEDVEVVLAATVVGSVDGTPEEWNFDLTEIRYFDADGVADDESSLGLDAVQATIVEEGEGDELDISASSDDPDATTFTVEEGETEDAMIFAFEIDADGSDRDIELNDVVIEVSGTADDADGDNLEDFIGDFWIEIDGESFDPEDYNGNDNTETLTFEVDGDVTIDADEAVTVMVYAELDIDDDFNSATVTAETVSVEGEGADDITVTEVVTGEEHTVVSEGIVVPEDGFTGETDTSGDNDTIGNFDLEFEVTAFEGDFYIHDNAAESATSGVQFAVDGGTATVTATLSSTADETTSGGEDFFLVEEGETETFTLSVNVDAAASGDFRVTLQEVYFGDDTDLGTADDVRTLSPASSYRTAYEYIQG